MKEDKPFYIKLLHEKHGETLKPGDTVKFYTANVSVARSNMSAKIRLYIVLDGGIVCLKEQRVGGIGLNRGHWLAYNTFLEAWPTARYQDHMRHDWI